ncbi:MAG: CBS domain-containing protein [Bacteroidota bacterium]
MILAQFIQSHYPVARLTDSAEQVMDWMEEMEVKHLPVTGDTGYLGLVDKEWLEDLPADTHLSDISHLLAMIAGKEQDFITTGLQLMAAHSLTVLPVVNEGQLIGVISATEMIRVLAVWQEAGDKQGILVIESTPEKFSLGEINRLLETNDLSIRHLNTRFESGQIIASIRVSRTDIYAAVGSLQRYGYTVSYYQGSADDNQELQDNYQHLLSYLNL